MRLINGMTDYKEEFKRVVGRERYTLGEYIAWLEQRLQGMESGKRTIFRDDLVVCFGKLWRVDWFDGSTLGISNNAGEHKEVGEGCVKLLSTMFREKPIEEVLP